MQFIFIWVNNNIKTLAYKMKRLNVQCCAWNPCFVFCGHFVCPAANKHKQPQLAERDQKGPDPVAYRRRVTKAQILFDPHYVWYFPYTHKGQALRGEAPGQAEQQEQQQQQQPNEQS